MCHPFVLILIVKFSWLCGCCKFFLFPFWSLTKFLFPAGSKMRVCCSWWDCLHCPGNITSYIRENISLHGGFGKWILCIEFEFAVCKLLVYWEWHNLFPYLSGCNKSYKLTLALIPLMRYIFFFSWKIYFISLLLLNKFFPIKLIIYVTVRGSLSTRVVEQLIEIHSKFCLLQLFFMKISL